MLLTQSQLLYRFSFFSLERPMSTSHLSPKSIIPGLLLSCLAEGAF